MGFIENINEIADDINTCPMSDLQRAYLFGASREIDFHVAPHYYIDFDISSLNIQKLNAAVCQAFHLFDIFKVGVDTETGDFTHDAARDLRQLYPAMPLVYPDIEAVRKRLARSELDLQDALNVEYSRGDDGAWYASFNFSLIYFDGPSINSYLDALNNILEDQALGVEPALAMFHHARSQERAAAANRERDLEYWEQRLAQFSSPLALPLIQADQANRRSELARLQFTVKREAIEQFSRCCAQAGISPNSLFFTVYAYCLSRWSSKKSFYITMMMQNLPDQCSDTDVRPLGSYTTTVLTEFNFNELKSLQDYALTTQRQLFLDMAHSSVSGIAVQRMLNLRNHSHGDLSQIAFVSMVGGHFSGNEGVFSINSLSARHSVLETPQMTLDHQIIENGEGDWIFNWDYQSGAFEGNVAQDIFEYYQMTVSELVAGHTALGDTVSPSLPAYQQRELARVNHDYRVMRDDQGCLFDGFLQQVRGRPDSIALISDDIVLSYADCYRLCLRLGRELKRQGVVPGDRVAVLMPKCWQQYVAAMAIVLHGGVYVPLDDQLPVERLAFIFDVCEIKVAILNAPNEVFSSLLLATIIVPDPDSTPSEALVLPSSLPVAPSDLAYIIFTSGSTGTPKGVEISHGAAYNTISDINREFGIGAGDRLLAVSSFSFDLSVYDLFGTLAAGAAIVVPDGGKVQYAEYINDLIDRHAVSIWNSAPLLLSILANRYKGLRGSIAGSLRLVMLSGDWIPMNLPEDIQAIAKGRPEVISLGGATEASIWSIYHRYSKTDLKLPSIPYGVPLDNQHFYILDENLQPCPFYVTGDLYIGGLGLANGYWRDGEKTAAAFITHPATGAIIYKTGDLGRYLESGEIQFQGRSDSQVKISGYRIELGEIEHALIKVDQVKQVAVVAPQGIGGERFLAAYYQLEAGSELTADDLKLQISRSLPNYMIPAIVKQLDSLPLTPNGKLDREVLSRVELHNPQSQGAFPTTVLQTQLAGIWRDLLGEHRFTLGDDFFYCGGYSFLAIKLLQAIEKRFHTSVSIQDFYANPTIAGLERLIDSQSPTLEKLQRNALVRLSVDHNPVAMVFVHPSGGEVNCYRELSARLRGQVDSFALRLDQREFGVDQLAEYYAGAVATLTDYARIVLAGWSFGGTMIDRICDYLPASQKDKLAGLIMLDAPFPLGPVASPPTEKARWFIADVVKTSNLLDSVDEQALVPELQSTDPDGLLERIGRLAGLETGTVALLQHYYSNFMACLAALETYEVRVDTNHTPLLVIKAQIVSPCVSSSSYSQESTWGWHRKYPNINTQTVSGGDHFCLLIPQSQQLISNWITDFLSEWEVK